MKNILLLLLLTAGMNSFAQSTFRGRVTDQQTGQPLTGATIAVKGTSTATSTDKKGEFEISSSQSIQNLTVSFVGYEPQQLSVNTSTKFINIEMSIGTASLNAVTVTGYENNRKLFETAGSIGLLKTREIQRGIPGFNYWYRGKYYYHWFGGRRSYNGDSEN